MKKIQKGKPGYLNYKRKVEILRTVIYFVIVLAIFALGYWQTHTRLNLLTVVAILGCLPASKALVGVIARYPYQSIELSQAKEIAGKSGHNIYGYTHYEKVNTDELGKHIKTILAQNQYTGFTVKILNQYTPFLARVEGLENIAVVEQEDTKAREQEIRNLILNISM